MNNIYFFLCEFFLVQQWLWKIVSRDVTTCRLVRIQRHVGKNLLPQLCTLRMESIRSSKRSVNFCRTSQRKVQEDSTANDGSCAYYTGLLLQYVTAYCSTIYSDKWMRAGNSITLQMSKWSSKLFILKLYLLTFFEYLCNFKTLQRNNQHQWNSQFLS